MKWNQFLLFSQENLQEPTLTPDLNQKLTMKIAGYHAKVDKIGSSYFIQENYDDFYYGKGSSY
jgi:hypothetical protein